MKLNYDDDNAGLGGQAMDDQDMFDCISTMLRQEEHYLCHDYMEIQQVVAPGAGAALHLHMREDAIDETCRSKMCEWIFHVIDSTRLQRETASVAMSYLDRFLCTSSERAMKARFNRKEYQLAAMTCLYIAVKLHEPFELDAGLMSRLSRGIHSAEEITTLEYDILIALEWRMNGPTPFQFVNHILELLPDSLRTAAQTLYEHSHFQTELAAGDYAYVPHLRPSTVGVACILNSLGGLERDSLPYNECIRFVREISDAFNLDIDSPLVNEIRGRLLDSFAKSSGYELSPGPIPIPKLVPCEKKVNALDDSPACVAKEMAFSLGEYME